MPQYSRKMPSPAPARNNTTSRRMLVVLTATPIISPTTTQVLRMCRVGHAKAVMPAMKVGTISQ